MVKAEMGTQVCQPVRVLHVLGRLNMGGAESRIMDLYRHIDRSKVQFDFLVHTEARPADGETTSEALMAARRPDDFDAEIRSLGGRIYALPRFNGRNFAAYRRAAEAFFAAHHDWVLVEGHMTSMASVYLPIAKAAGVPHTAAHVRSAGVDPGIRQAVSPFPAAQGGRTLYLFASRRRDGVWGQGHGLGPCQADSECDRHRGLPL